MLHAGSENGWIPGVSLVFESKRNTGDYHDEMDHRTFEEWFSKTLLPKIPSSSIIVMDNAPYHSRRKEPLPTKNWTKAMLIEWLSSKGISFPESCLKAALWKIAEENRPRSPIYVVDDLATQAGMS